MEIKHSKPYLDENDIKSIYNQTKSGNHSTQNKTKLFEIALSKLIGHKYAKATSSGTTALHLALLSLNIKEKDEVIIPSYVCQSVLNAVNYTKATPILTDIDIDNFNISIKTIKPFITYKTKAIILPHLFGIPSDIEPLIELSNHNNIAIIEDCAQSLGVKFEDYKLTGSKTLISIFSFYATKMISTGQGGMILTSNDNINKKINDITTYDKKENYTLGYNYNMTDIQAALGISQLNKLDYFIKRRKEIAEKYNEAFKYLPIKLTNYKNNFPFRYIIQLDNKEQRDNIINKLEEKEIKTDLPVFKPLHHFFNLPKEDFPNTEHAFNTNLSIPIYPALNNKEVDRVIDIIKDII